MTESTPLEVLLCDETMREEYMDAKLVRTFFIATSHYAVLRKEDTDTLCILKIVEHDGSEELHEIETEAEFQSAVEVFRNLPD
ncbi:DUF1292 domain-containing protein [Aneurinibacillus tyrosinisolvens]|uniref:DUF1292 domain-containing protein n=1 Tax=Aneurinibacillus tyrosinisolvens TaxID=1443435 RepID=UPI00063EE316|nr:DUF1292 domain-containing protein [Aneurinibacillus tyrosinisolvens]